MKELFLLYFFVCGMLFGLSAQHIVEAQPPGGVEVFLNYVNTNFALTEEGKHAKASGEVIVEFHVNETGSIDSFDIVKDIGYGTAIQLIKVVKSAGDWDSRLVKGEAVSSWVRLPYSVVGGEVQKRYSLSDDRFSKASPVDGYELFVERFKKNFVIPQRAANANAYGDYTLQFQVKENGKLTSFKILNDPGLGILENATRSAQKSGTWYPAVMDGVEVSSRVEVPFTIELKRAKRF